LNECTTTRFPASASLNAAGTELTVSSPQYLRGGAARFRLYETVAARLTCTFSPRSPRPSQIKIQLVSFRRLQQESERERRRQLQRSGGGADGDHGDDDDDHGAAAAAAAAVAAVAAAAASADAAACASADREERKSLYTAMERLNHRLAQDARAAAAAAVAAPGTADGADTPSGGRGDGRRTSTSSSSSSSSSSNSSSNSSNDNHKARHPKQVVHAMGRFRFGAVARADPQATSRGVATLGRLSHTASTPSAAADDIDGDDVGGGGGSGLRARSTLEGAQRNPEGEQARKLKDLESQALERTRKLAKAKGKARRFG
jgi:hypothetical protein